MCLLATVTSLIVRIAISASVIGYLVQSRFGRQWKLVHFPGSEFCRSDNDVDRRLLSGVHEWQNRLFISTGRCLEVPQICQCCNPISKICRHVKLSCCTRNVFCLISLQKSHINFARASPESRNVPK